MALSPHVDVVDTTVLPSRGAQWIGQLIRASVEARRKASIALSGGRTPEPVYRELAAMPNVPWECVEIFFGDERRVPPDDPRSNYRMAREALLAHVPVTASAIHRIEAERPDPEKVAAEYAVLLPDRFDLIILGLGEDGHTASLFPHSAALEERIRRVLAVPAPSPPDRITVTPPVLAAARDTLVIADGARKAGAVRQALLEDVSPLDCPASLVRNGLWLLDRMAGEALTST